jgi:2,4-dienoyl-CoA reductase-like NADH-dependent reductase (Old Yellow Enzyme family)
VPKSRFLLEVLEAVRAGIGPDRLLGVRLGCDDFTELDGLAEIAKMVAGSGRVNYLNGSVRVAGISQYLITSLMGDAEGHVGAAL